MSTSILQDNLMKAMLALQYVKEALDPLIETTCRAAHKEILDDVAKKNGKQSKCNRCTTQTILMCPTVGVCSGKPCRFHAMQTSRPCPNGVCDLIRDAIFKRHAHNSPLWSNTNATKWCEDYFEIIKCFVPSTYNAMTNLAELDLAGQLNLIRTFDAFKGMFSDDPSQGQSKVMKVLEARNSIMHSAQGLTSDKFIKLKDVFIALLSDKAFSQEKIAGEVIRRLKKLPNMNIVLEDRGDETTQSPISMTSEMTKSPSMSTSEKSRKHWSGMSWDSWLNNEFDSQDMLEDLIESDTLPRSTELHDLCRLLGKKSPFLKTICEKIASSIKQTSSHILHVWAGYKMEKVFDVLFVAITDTKDANALFQRKEVLLSQYKVIFRHVNDCADEGKDIMKKVANDGCRFTSDELQQYRLSMQAHSAKLMQEHSNIEMLSACPIKSTKYGTDEWETQYRTCIVVYVHVKGIIPLQDECFPKQLIDFPVDVREGRFITYGKAADFHSKLKMGCAISSSLRNSQGQHFQGTLGAFLDHPNKTYCLTCAHVVLNSIELQNVQNNNGCLEYSNNQIPVYQPTPDSRHQFGHVVKAMYHSGGYGNTGMEVALIEINDRHPDSGSFPDANFEIAGFNSTTPMMYSSGQICPTSEFLNNQHTMCSEIVKFGSETEVTRGSFYLVESSVRKTPYSVHSDLFHFQMHDQIEVLNIGPTPFSQEGDSGALVFCLYNGNRSDLRPVGIIEGGTLHGTCIITPLSDILSKLQLKMKSFDDAMETSQTTIPLSLPTLAASSNPQDRLKSITDQLEIMRRKINKKEQAHASHIDAVRGDMATVKSELRREMSTVRQDMMSGIQVQNVQISQMNTAVNRMEGRIQDELRLQINRVIDTMLEAQDNVARSSSSGGQRHTLQ